MLPERDLVLLTAYIDGELSARQRRLLLRLLHKSPEARRLLAKLQRDSRDIIDLPRQRLDADFSQRVLEAIAEHGARPVGRRPVPQRLPRLASLAGWAAAAAILIAVGAASYLAFPLLLKNDRHKNAPVAAKDMDGAHGDRVIDRKPDNTKRPRPNTTSPAEVAHGTQVIDPMIDQAPGSPAKKSGNGALATQPDRPSKNPDLEPDDQFLLGSPSDSNLPRVDDPNLSVMMPLRDVSRQETKTRLLAKLGKDSAFHVQMLCRDTAKALDQLRSVLAAGNIHLVIDQGVLARAKNPKSKMTFVVYAENLEKNELVEIFERLGRPDPKATPKGPDPIGYVVVNSMSPKFRQQVRKFLDLPSLRSSPPKSKAPLGVDVRKPLEDGTAADVERQMKDREGARGNGKPAGAKMRKALVLGYREDSAPLHAGAARSKQIKHFRETRPEPLPGTLQVVLVLLRDNI